MTFTVYQVIGLFVAVHIAYWAIRKLIAHYAIRSMYKYHVCAGCLAAPTPKIVLNSEWAVKTDAGDIAMCDTCRKRLLPDELTDEAMKMGVLIKLK